MTDTTITQGFIEMVKAYEAKPELEAKIVNLTQDVEFFERNLRIEEDFTRNLRETIAKLEASLAEVKKERDDAMFRNLELDEKLNGIEKFLGVAERLEKARREEHQATVDALNIKPETKMIDGVLCRYDPATDAYYPAETFSAPINPVVVESQPNFDGPAIPDQGQSGDRPTDTGLIPSTTAGQPENDITISKDGPETQTQSEPKINPYSGFHVHYPNGEYKGWVYTNKPTWVSWAAFVDGGGDPEPWMH